MKTDTLLKEIDEVFQVVPMPSRINLTVHLKGCFDCEEVLDYLDYYRNRSLDGAFFMYMRRNLTSLSPIGFLWLIPYYLKYCLSFDWNFTEEPICFLIYTLNPPPEYEHDAFVRLSALNYRQIICLIHFLEWCNENENYASYSTEDDTENVFIFLKRILQKTNDG